MLGVALWVSFVILNRAVLIRSVCCVSLAKTDPFNIAANMQMDVSILPKPTDGDPLLIQQKARA